MSTEVVREWLNRKPFEPFLIALSDGETYQVRHPENVMVLKTRLVLGYPETDTVIHASLLHVNSINPIQSVS